MEAFQGPIIGAINGHAVTGGVEMALACDILIASENARFADTHARVGILPGWGLSQKLPRLIGLSRAKEISFTGTPVFARQTLDWGLVNHVVATEELLPRAIKMTQDMCKCVPHILLQYKPPIDDGYSMPYKEALAWEEQQAIASARQAFASTIASRLSHLILYWLSATKHETVQLLKFATRADSEDPTASTERATRLHYRHVNPLRHGKGAKPCLI